jgi:hypothetical protein
MSTLHDLKDRLRSRVDDADVLGDVEHALADARRKLGTKRERLGEAAADTVDELRDEAGDAVRDARRRTRRMRRRARKQTRALRGHGRTPAIVVAAIAGASALVAGLARSRSLRSAAARAAKTVGGAAKRAACAPRRRKAAAEE